MEIADQRPASAAKSAQSAEPNLSRLLLRTLAMRLDGLTCGEIARREEVSRQAIKDRCSRALRQLTPELRIQVLAHVSRYRGLGAVSSSAPKGSV